MLVPGGGRSGARQRRGFSPAAAARHQGRSESGREKICECFFLFNFEILGVYLV